MAAVGLLGPFTAHARAPYETDSAQLPTIEKLPGHLDGFAMVQMAEFLDDKPPTFNGMLQLDAGIDVPHFALLAVPRLRIDDFRAPHKSAAFFFQQLWIATRGSPGIIKAGKIMSQFGRVWDYGLYGPLLANTDVKLTPDWGLSLENTLAADNGAQLFYALQYFPIDGKAFRILDKHPFSTQYARRRDTSNVRVQPSIPLGPGRGSLGLSAQHFRSVRRQMAHVWRVAMDVDYTQEGLDAFVEAGHQFGADVPSSDTEVVAEHTYLWAGAQKAVGPVLLRHHINLVFYPRGERVLDVLHQPGAEWLVSNNFSLIAEAAFWHNAPNVAGRGDRSLFLVAMGKL